MKLGKFGRGEKQECFCYVEHEERVRGLGSI